MNILVTGGAGFIGSQMAKRHLADGHRVVIVDNLSTRTARDGCPTEARFVQADIAETDLEPLLAEEKIEFVSHHARADRPAPQRRGPDRRRALEHHRLAAGSSRPCRARACARVLFSSTGGALYGEPEGGPPGAGEPPDQPDLALRLREALDREVPPLLPRRSTASRRRSSATPTCTGRGRTAPARPASSRSSRRRCSRTRPSRSTATASRRATTSSSATSSRRRRAPPRRTRSGVWNLGTGVETSVNRALPAARRRVRLHEGARCTCRPRPASRCAACSTAPGSGATSACRRGRRSQEGSSDRGVLPAEGRGGTAACGGPARGAATHASTLRPRSVVEPRRSLRVRFGNAPMRRPCAPRAGRRPRGASGRRPSGRPPDRRRPTTRRRARSSARDDLVARPVAQLLERLDQPPHSELLAVVVVRLDHAVGVEQQRVPGLETAVAAGCTSRSPSVRARRPSARAA